MQKAFVVRTSAGESLKNPGRTWSQPVDSGEDRPLPALLADGWRVASSCPMPGDLDGCCLVVLEAADRPADAPLATLADGCQRSASPRARRSWDGETIPLTIFGVG